VTKFIGGMNVPKRFGRLNASMPLAELVLETDAIILRPRWISAWVIDDFAIPVSDVAVAYPLSRRWFARGIGIAMTDARVAYFWTNRQDEVLTALRARGLTVDLVPRRASLWRRNQRQS
jgi:hypothetical protein